MPIKTNRPQEPILSPKLERKRIVKPKVAAELRDESEDSVNRHLADKRVQLVRETLGIVWKTFSNCHLRTRPNH
jgi:hypothetical protein